MLSGVNLGLYIFDVNPTNYDIYPQKRTQGYDTILDSDPTISKTYKKFTIKVTWQEVPHYMWNQLEPYARKNVAGVSEDICFWDADFQRFQGSQIKIEELEGTARGGNLPVDRYDVSMLIREI